MSTRGGRKKDRKTALLHAGREYCEHGFVNPPVQRGSTVLAPALADYESGRMPYTYGVHGTPTSRALETAIARLEGGHGCRLAPSGLAAITAVLLAFTKGGDHILLSDSLYGPTSRAALRVLGRFGVETEFFDPRATAEDLEALMRENTSLLFLESPGSHTMEVQDVPALAAVAKKHGVVTVIDNTWSAGWFFDAFAAGCDISIQAATKYHVGHSDVLIGAVTYTREMEDAFLDTYRDLGLCTSPDDAWLTLRGMRTLEVRLTRHEENALKVAAWLKARPEVEEVYYPALPGAPGHELWKRDFTGASGLFSFALKPVSEKALAEFVDNLELFGIGASWGGFESLILRSHIKENRRVTKWPHEGPTLRLHIGLEDAGDLIADLDAGFERLAAAGA